MLLARLTARSTDGKGDTRMCRNGTLLHTVLLWLGCMGSVLPVHAQDMQFGLDESGQSAPATPAAGGPPSEALGNALRLYTQERYQEASVQFQRVVEGETPDAPANVQK